MSDKSRKAFNRNSQKSGTGAFRRARLSRTLTRSMLLAGTSLATLTFAVPSAYAIKIGGGDASATTAATVAAGAAAQAAAAQALQAAQNASQSMGRAIHSLQTTQALQAAARAAAQAQQSSTSMPGVNVPNGLGAGGLDPAAGWSGANGPTQTAKDGRTNVNINQTQQQAILNWKTFNIGSQTTLEFDQHGNTNWVALNRVDATTGPSQILGNMKADGQVYVINQSGIIFGGASQINVGALIASTANITDDQFKNSGIYSTQTGGTYLPSFTGATGKIIVESGAQISTNAPTSVTSGGGYVLLMGSEVTNFGSITTPKGQTILAAGDDFVLRKGFGTEANQNSSTRGIEISPFIAVGSTRGTVTNAGLIFSQQGDVTMAGHTVLQDGILLSTTSVNQRGTIHLLNSATDADGSVTLTGDSLTAILPELDSTDTALNAKRDALIAASGGNPLATGQFDNLSALVDRKDRSRVEIVTGGTANFEDNSLTLAQGGDVSVSATKRVFTQAGATIDVSGVQGVVRPADANMVLVNIQGNELRDSPQNRDSGKLLNSDVWIDARDLIFVPAGTGGYATDRYYTPGGLLEVSGYVGNTAHTIGEWTAVGGTITLNAPEVVAQKGSIFNISGGSVQYQAGYVNQTMLLGSDGRLYGVDDAPGYLSYKAVADGFVVDHSRAGITEVYHDLGGNKNLRWEEGYTAGRDAGQLVLSTPTGVFEGDIVANVIIGERQTATHASGTIDGYKSGQTAAPLAGQLIVGKYGNLGYAGGYNSDIKIGDFASITEGMSADSALPSDRANTVYLDATHLTQQNLGGLNLTSTDQIAVDAPVAFAPGAQISFAAPNIAIHADLTAHSGTVTLGNEIQTRLTQTQKPFWQALLDSQRQSQITIDNDAKIDLSGLWLNQQLDGSDSDLSALAFLNGGTLNVATTGGVTFAAGSIIDVSSGAAILANGKTQGAKGGNVSLIANDDSRVLDSNASIDPSAPLIVGGKIIAYGFNGGGTLTLKAGQTVVIGDDATLTSGNLAAGTSTSTSIRLAQDVVIPAGGKMPFDYTTVLASVPVDAPLASVFTPTLGSSAHIVSAASWVVPPGVSIGILNSAGNGNISLPAGSTLPAGATIAFISSIPAGTVIPSSVFPHGIPITPILLGSYKAGDVVTAAVTLPAGTIVPVDTKFDQSIAIQPALALNENIFRSGFSNFSVSSNTGLEIASAVAAEVPVYRFNTASFTAPTGSRVSDAADLWLPPTYLEDPLSSRLTQRAGASLTFSSLYDFNMTRGSSLTVDPGQNVTIYANRQTTIDGSITAHGGNITVASVPNAPTGLSYNDGFGILTPTRSIWIGEGSTLDASAQAVIRTDARGNSYGIVPGGGSITLGGTTKADGTSVASDAFIIVRPGALLDASGTAGTIDVSSASGLQPTLVASDGGTIALYSASGMYLDGDLRAAAGGIGASGGLLSLNVLGHTYAPSLPTPVLPFAVGEIPEEMQRLRNITIVQHDQATALSSNLAPGERDPALKFGEATISVDKIHAGGFDQLSLSTHDLFVFDGNVDLAMNRSIVLTDGFIVASASNPNISVHLAAPYVKLDGRFSDPAFTIVGPDKYYPGMGTIFASSVGVHPGLDSSFTVDADLIDVPSSIQFGVKGPQGNGSIYWAGIGNPGNKPSQGDIVDEPGFSSVVLHSSGDIRLGTGKNARTGQLATEGNLTIEAAQIYPLSGANFTLAAGQYQPASGPSAWHPDATITIRSSGDVLPDMPSSVFGNLAIIAPNIDQGGVVRAPLGVIAFNNVFGRTAAAPPTSNVVFRSGSLTSTSANGLTIPFGGTSDGVTYQGADGTIENLGSTSVLVDSTSRVETGLMIYGQHVTGEAGAVLDVSGGGNLLGAGFISGRGGSVNVLTTALVNANPANSTFSAASNKVYAIAPGYASAYAPSIATNGAGDPAIGQQITIPVGVPGLPAGTYTLLPSSYALLPGAYRVELGSRTPAINAPAGLPNGSVLTSGYLGFANTATHDSLPTQVILTAGQTVRTYSQYNETSYADFLRSQADLFGGIRPRLPIDGGILQLGLGIPSSGKALSFAGTALFNGVDGGVAGTLAIQTSDGTGTIDIAAPGQAAIPGHVTVSSDDINLLNAPSLIIGGTTVYSNDTGQFTGGRIYFTGSNVVNVLDGATLRAGQIFLVGSTVSVSNGAMLDTRGLGSSGVDSTLGYAYGNTPGEINTPSGPAVLAVANGWFNFLPFVGTGTISVASGASLLTEGSIVLGAPGSLTMGDANLGARYLAVTQTTVNVGTDASLAAAQTAHQLPSGWNLTQSVLDRLLRPSATAGVPALEQLTVVAGGSINFIGDVSLDARGNSGSDVQFVINTPALYGLGSGGEGAHITADSFVWNGIRTGNGIDPATNPNGVPYGSKDPTVISPNGPGTGLGTLDIAAENVLFGYGDHTRATDGTSLNRYAIGFSAVNISASDHVTTNSDGALFVGLSRDASGNVQGGSLNITTPLLTAQQGAVMAFNTGGAITVTAPAGAAPANTANVTNLGGTVSFNGDSVVFDTAAALPSGKLTLNAINDVFIGGHAVIDLSGRLLTFFDKSAYSWGGDLVLQSAHGDITQAAGSLIDVSAQNNVAGSITATATDPAHGGVLFNGALKGSSTGDYASGEFTIQAQDLGNFAALNVKMNDAGFFGARAFDIKRGDLVIGNEVKANYVSISVDGGSLTVNGTIDASGTKPGTIRLAARDDLTLASTAVLDTHSTVLQTDSYGAPIEANNTAHVELTTTSGALTLSAGATIDMRVNDPKNVDKFGNPVIYGRLELNAPRIGADDINIDASGGFVISGAAGIALNGFRTYVLPDGSTINQAYLDTLDADSTAFIDAALQNAALANRTAGLSAYVSAFHLRPGIEITSSGQLTVDGDLDLSGYRYGPNADRDPLSATYGRGEPGKLVIRAGGDLSVKGSINDGFAPPPRTPDDNRVVVIPSRIPAADEFPATNFTLAEDWTIPNDSFYNAMGFVTDASGVNFWLPGQAGFDTIPAGTVIDVTGAGASPFAWEAGVSTPKIFGANGGSRPNYAAAPMLAAGSMSWSMRLVGGADVAAADSRTLQVASVLNGLGNVTLDDTHTAGSNSKPGFSVIRTGTGDLDILAGGNYQQLSPYGVYTAGTAIPVDPAYNLQRSQFATDTVLGWAGAGYETLLDGPRMYYTTGGGDLLLRAQGDIRGNLAATSAEVGDWLWRQGGAELGQATAWGINFGSYTAMANADLGPQVMLAGFSGVGALGGGNVAVTAGGNIGDTGGIVIAVGGSGRVLADGTLVQTGGGTLSVKAGGNVGGAGNQFVDIRGDTNVSTGDFGSLYGQNFGYNGAADPRSLDTMKSYSAAVTPGGTFVPGDGTVNIRARGDIAMGDIVDPGRVRLTGQTDVQGPQAATWFTLWTQNTALDLFGAGGSVSPLSAFQGNDIGFHGGDNVSTLFLPSILRATAGNGDIFLFAGDGGASLMLPSPSGELQLLAAGSVIDTARPGSGTYGPIATSLSTLATPFHPGWATSSADNFSSTLESSNYWSDPNQIPDGSFSGSSAVYSSSFDGELHGVGGNPFVFGPNTVSDASAFGGNVTSSIYAVHGDILNVRYGEAFVGREAVSGITTETNYYRPAKSVHMRAGGDIVNLKGVILQNDPNDVSVIAASGNVIYAGAAPFTATAPQSAGLVIAGPGTLEISAGKNLYQGSAAAIESIGPLVTGDKRPGASVVLQAGLGDGRPGEGQVDWTGFASLYLDPANLAGSGPLADQPGKVAKTYNSELMGWLKTRFGYAGSAGDALAYFLALPTEQQRIFLRIVYYAELTAGGREFNDKNGPRPGSYLRGREAIAALFPNDQAYNGSITMFTGKSPLTGAGGVSGFVHTDFGGDIQLLAPGGGVTIGAEGVTPGLDSGLVTQGSGNIQIYSQDSVLLGLSRIMTTFGGSILAWSAEGDINAGRGSKTTVVFTPPRVIYDEYGNISLSPVAPSTGAGIATLNPIPEVLPGDIDLIAPLGTIDAGEAGIRVSGDVNLAALHVANAANIQVQGNATGVPTVQGPPVAALTTAANTAGANQQTGAPSQNTNAPTSVWMVEIVGYGGSQGSDDSNDDNRRKQQ